MALAIRKLQEERKEWEAEKEAFQENQAWQEGELSRLQAEVAQLRVAPPAASPTVVQHEMVLSAPVQAHHEQQVKLLTTIDGLKRELQQERERNRPPDRTPDMPGGLSPLDMTMASALRPVPPSEEFANLEDENLRLREELNSSKEKVIELKRAAAKRCQDWRAEMQTITEELASKQALEEEAATLRKERARLEQELINSRKQVGSRESVEKAEIERLRAELQQAQENIREISVQAKKADEMEALSQMMTSKVMELEQELSRKLNEHTRKLNEHTRLLSLFFKHAEQPLEALRAGCRRLLGFFPIAIDTVDPERFVPSIDDFQENLVQVVDLLRWAEEVMQGLENIQRPRQQYSPFHGNGYSR